MVWSLPNRFRTLWIFLGKPRDPFRAVAIAFRSRRRCSFSFRKRFHSLPKEVQSLGDAFR
jgi:hypothetical protein